MKLGWRAWAVVVVIVFALIGLPRMIPLTPRAISVEVASVELGPVEDVVANSEAGTVRSRAQARLGAERAGRVAAIRFREGTRTRAGDVVLRLDMSSALTRLEAARRDLQALDALHQAAHSAAALSLQSHERIAQLHSQGLVPQEQMDQSRSRREAAEAELRAAEARMASAESAVRLAQDEIDHLVVRAPFDGVITRRLVEVGESVIPGQPVLEMVSPDRLYVSAPIDERDAGRLAEGLVARVTIDAYPGALWQGTVTRVAPMVDETRDQNRTVEIEVEIPPRPGRRPSPGMTADVEIVIERRQGVRRVPSAAVIEGRRVLVPERGRAVTREVEIGLKNWQWTEIRSGLQPRQWVITSLDRAGLKAGARVAAAQLPPGRGGADTTMSAAVR